MSDLNETGDRILRETKRQLEERGLSICGMHPEMGQISVQNVKGRVARVSLVNLVDYSYRSGDANAVRDFVAKVAALFASDGNAQWDAVKDRLYCSLVPVDPEGEDLPFGKNMTGYCDRIFIIDEPDMISWVTPGMAAEWDVDESILERQALANGDALLAVTDLRVENVQGHPLGSFLLRDRTLNAALLLAPSLKDKVGKDFGWPLYAVIPNRIICRFFGKPDLAFFEERLPGFVSEHYDNPRFVSPQLLEFSDSGIRSLCSWTKKMGYIIRFDDD